MAPSCVRSALGVALEAGTDDAAFLLHDAEPGMLGWTRRDLALVPAAQLVHPDDRERIPTGASWGPLRSIQFVPFELRLLSRDSRYWSTRWYLSRRPDGAVGAIADCVLGPDSDVGPAVGVWQWNSTDDTLSWSVELLNMFGFRSRPPTGRLRLLDVVLPEDRPNLARHFDRALDRGEPFVVAFRGAMPGRRDRWFQAAGRRFEHDGCRQLGGIVKDLNPPRNPTAAVRVIGHG
jgi:PAS domain-containing protein